jgi:acyl dehydratase
MPITYPDILDVRSGPVPFSWTDQDTMLYALGTGMGEDPLDARELPFVYERDQKVLPTFATIAARPGDPGPLPLNRALVLDGGRDLVIHRPLPPAGDVELQGRILSVADNGEGKGAILTREVTITDMADALPLATLVTTVFARGDGGFGGPPPVKPAAAARPDRAPDRVVRIATRPGQALLYRLSGDRNPLHGDPAAAGRAGFDRPILHGLCTYGICCRALLQSYADYDAAAIRQFAVRFSAPCYPGETITTYWWQVGDELVFEAKVEERNVVIAKNGRARLA